MAPYEATHNRTVAKPKLLFDANDFVLLLVVLSWNSVLWGQVAAAGCHLYYWSNFLPRIRIGTTYASSSCSSDRRSCSKFELVYQSRLRWFHCSYQTRFRSRRCYTERRLAGVTLASRTALVSSSPTSLSTQSILFSCLFVSISWLGLKYNAMKCITFSYFCTWAIGSFRVWVSSMHWQLRMKRVQADLAGWVSC